MQLCTTLGRLEEERSSAEARADDAKRQLASKRTELAALQDELDQIKGQRDVLTAALTEWGEWHRDLALRLVQTLEVQRAWLTAVDPALDSNVNLVSLTGGQMPMTDADKASSVELGVTGSENPVSLIVRLESMATEGKLVREG